MKKAQWFMLGFAVCMITIISVGMVRYPVGQPVPHEVYTAVSDPCDAALSYLEPSDPNWIRDFGDNERTRHIHQTSKNRVMILRDEQKTAEIARRLIVLESLHIEELRALSDPNDPNEVVE